MARHRPVTAAALRPVTVAALRPKAMARHRAQTLAPIPTLIPTLIPTPNPHPNPNPNPTLTLALTLQQAGHLQHTVAALRPMVMPARLPGMAGRATGTGTGMGMGTGMGTGMERRPVTATATAHRHPTPTAAHLRTAARLQGMARRLTRGNHRRCSRRRRSLARACPHPPTATWRHQRRAAASSRHGRAASAAAGHGSSAAAAQLSWSPRRHLWCAVLCRVSSGRSLELRRTNI